MSRVNTDREAQLTLETIQAQLNTIQGEPYASGQLAVVRVVKASIQRTEAAIECELT